MTEIITSENLTVSRKATVDYMYDDRNLEQLVDDIVRSKQEACPLAGECALSATCERDEIYAGDGTSPDEGLFGMSAGPTVEVVQIRISDNHPDCPHPNAFIEVAREFDY